MKDYTGFKATIPEMARDLASKTSPGLQTSMPAPKPPAMDDMQKRMSELAARKAKAEAVLSQKKGADTELEKKRQALKARQDALKARAQGILKQQDAAEEGAKEKEQAMLEDQKRQLIEERKRRLTIIPRENKYTRH